MWPDLPKGVLHIQLPKGVLHIHNFKTHLSLPFDSYINGSKVASYMCLVLLKFEQSTITQASFSSLSNIHECSGCLQMAPSSLDKQIANCDSPQDWLMSLTMDLAALCDMWIWNGTNGCHLAVFSEDVAFACHFVVPRLPPPPTL